MAFTIIDQDSFVSSGVGVKIPVPSSADYMRVQNLTQAGTTQVVGRGVEFEWYKGLTPQGGQIRWFKDNGGNGLNLTSDLSGGFVYVQSFPQPEAPVVGTAITQADPAVVTMVNSYSEGDRVRLYATTGMLQIGGMDFTISSVGAGGFTLLGLPSTLANGFAAAATAVTARRISKESAVEPAFLYITEIVRGLTTEVRVSTQHQYVVGMKIRFNIPRSFGCQELNGLTGTIIAAVGSNVPAGSSVYKFVVDIDSSAFSAFAFPLSTASPTAPLFATVAPAGQSTKQDPVTLQYTGYNFNFAPFHTGVFIPYMYLSAGVQSPAGSVGDVIAYQILKAET